MVVQADVAPTSTLGFVNFVDHLVILDFCLGDMWCGSRDAYQLHQVGKGTERYVFADVDRRNMHTMHKKCI